MDSLLFARFRLSIRSQAVYRILFAAFLLTSIGPNRGVAELQFWNNVPSDVRADAYLPTLGPAQYIGLPAAETLRAINVAQIALALLLFIGLWTTPASLLLTLGMVTTRLWLYTAGKVDHDILFVITPACLAFSRWGNDLSVDAIIRKSPITAPHDADSWPFALLAILVCFGMANSGLQKALGGWLDPSRLATVGWIVFMGDYWDKSSWAYAHLDKILHLPFWGLKAVDWVAVSFELLFLLAIARRSWFQAICLVAILFHFGTQLLFSIYFRHQILVYGAFFPWDRLLPECRLAPVYRRTGQASGGLRGVISATCIGGTFGVVIFLSRLVIPWGSLARYGSVFAAVVGLWYLGSRRLWPNKSVRKSETNSV